MKLQNTFKYWVNKKDALKKMQTPWGDLIVINTCTFKLNEHFFSSIQLFFAVFVIAVVFIYRLKTQFDKPLVILFQWLMAKPKHVKKYAELYIDHGYDVIAVNVTPWQVMWPTKGTQVSVKRFSLFSRKLFY